MNSAVLWRDTSLCSTSLEELMPGYVCSGVGELFGREIYPKTSIEQSLAPESTVLGSTQRSFFHVICRYTVWFCGR